MLIPIETNIQGVFKQYLMIINGILSKEIKLTPIEIDVLEKMLYIDYLYKHYPKDKRDFILFSKITKNKIREQVYNISEQAFNNTLLKLRKKGMITFTSLNVRVPIKDNKIELNFKLEIK